MDMYTGNPSAHKTPAVKREMKTFTLTELLFVMAIFAILSSLLFTSLNKAITTAGKIICMNNGKEIMMGLSGFTADNENKVPINIEDATGLYTHLLPEDLRVEARGAAYHLSWDDQLSTYLGYDLSPAEQLDSNFSKADPVETSKSFACPLATAERPDKRMRSYSFHGSGSGEFAKTVTTAKGISHTWFSHKSGNQDVDGYQGRLDDMATPSGSFIIGEFHLPSNVLGGMNYEDFSLWHLGSIIGPSGSKIQDNGATGISSISLESAWPHGLGYMTFMYGDGHVAHDHVIDTMTLSINVWSTTKSTQIEKNNGIWDCWRID